MNAFQKLAYKCKHLTKSEKLLIAYLPFHLIWYMLLEQINAGDDYYLMHCALDDLIPFCEWFIFPYLSWFLYMAVTGLYLLVKDSKGFRNFMLLLWTGFFLSCLFITFFSTGQELRPDVMPRENLATWIVGLIYAFDTNTNVFPSMHVIGALAVAVGIAQSEVLQRYRWVQICSPLLCLLIICATVFLKQHSALDVLGGVVFFAAAYIIVAVYKRLVAKRTQEV